jgi:hypothetical protein
MRCLSAGILVLMLAGCSETDPGLQKQRSVNVWMAQTVRDAQRDNALIAQHTLYSYHFIPDSPTLNDLGFSDLSILASHYRMHPGRLSVRRQDAPEDLHEARVAGVRYFLEKSGVQMDRMVVEDVLPGGDGAQADRVLRSLERDMKVTAPSSAPQTTSMAGAKSGEGVKK